ncbi:hypothetical protein DPMN_100133 [Dreissena polymorpha]|uniref:Uncharacterized protein n=1 Tax=Dreissena polymorpha TaxID=45954 RepID=A0A9D4LGR7_DREPO|nr:hypothetical protein DPMN_100133 [Dreissena polymorpha]
MANVKENASYIHIEKTAPSPSGHVFPLITTIFKLQQINKTNVLTKFHNDWAKNEMTTPGGKNLLTKCHEDWAKKCKNAPPLGGHAFSLITTIFKLNQDIHKTNDLTKRPPPWPPCFLPIQSIFELNCGIRETNVLTKFHEDWAKNVSSRLFTCFHYIHIEKSAPGGHVFSPIMTIFEIVRDIYKIDEKNVTSRVFTSFFFYYINRRNKTPWRPYINETNVLTKFHDDWAKILTSRLHDDWASIVTSTHDPLSNSVEVSLMQNVLTKFHKDRTINVASRVFTRQISTTDA